MFSTGKSLRMPYPTYTTAVITLSRYTHLRFPLLCTVAPSAMPDSMYPIMRYHPGISTRVNGRPSGECTYFILNLADRPLVDAGSEWIPDIESDFARLLCDLL